MRVGVDYTAAATQREGIGRVTRELVRHMLREPDRPDLHLLYAHRGPIRAVDALEVHNRIRVRRMPVSNRLALAAWHKVRLPIPIEALIGPVHVFHGPDFTLPPRLAAAGVLTVHDLTFMTRPQDAHPAQLRFLETTVPRCIDRARLIVAVSESTKRDLMTRLGVRPHRIRVVPNAVADDFRGVEDRTALDAVRARLSLPEEFVLAVGAVHPRKNLAGLALAAASAGSRRGRPIEVVHAGREAWLAERVYADVRAAGASVRFLGHVDEATLRALYSLATAFAFPSYAEGSALPVLEAFACGCPVLTSTAPGTAEVAGSAAVLSDPHDPRALADGLLRVLDEAELRAELRQRGRARLRQFSWTRSARAMLCVYEESRRGGPTERDLRARQSVN